MRATGLVFAAVGVVLLCGQPTRADDKEARAIIEKAMKATGGEANLSKYKGRIGKSKGKLYGFDAAGADYTAEDATLLPQRSRRTIESPMGKFIEAVDGGKGWFAFAEMAMDMPEEYLKASRERLHVDWVTTLVPLKDKAFTLSVLPEVKVGDRPAVGVKVSHEGRRDVQLYFDKENGLLVRTEAKAFNPMSGEVTLETLFSDYKEVSGMRVPMKAVINQDGKKFVEAEITEIKLVDKLDDKLFVKPSDGQRALAEEAPGVFTGG